MTTPESMISWRWGALAATKPDLANLDKWYRDQGQTIGAFTVYRVNLRPYPDKSINETAQNVGRGAVGQ